MSLEKRILITRSWPKSVQAILEESPFQVQFNRSDQPMDVQELAKALQEFDVICPTVTDSLDAQLFEQVGANVRCQLLANFGVGVNHIDAQAAAKLGITITNTPGVLTDATAEIAMSLLLMSARRAAEGERLVRSNNWQGWTPTHMLSTQVTAKVLGIVGMGRIGSALARQAHHGFGMEIVYHNRSAVDDSFAQEIHAQRRDLPTLLGMCDFVSLHCPATPETRGLIDAHALSLMPQHAHLINTARGDVVDEAALVAALSRGDIAGAGLDVYAAEPSIHEDLLSLENVVLLPHMGSGTRETRHAMGMRAWHNVTEFLAGHVPPDRV